MVTVQIWNLVSAKVWIWSPRLFKNVGKKLSEMKVMLIELLRAVTLAILFARKPLY